MSDDPRPSPADPALDAAYSLLNRLIGLVSLIIGLSFLLVFALAVAYVYFALNPDGFSGASAAAEQVRVLLTNVWSAVLPIATAIIRLAAPILILLVGLVILAYLSSKQAAPLDLSKVTSDLPSTLALVIILTICLLPLAGFDVPAVLNNIALVVVGFYFGKRETMSVTTT